MYRLIAFAVCTGLLLGPASCVERKLEIRSEPSGAQVILNGEDAGATPCTVPFMHYGQYGVVLSAPGHHRLRTTMEINAPVYQWIPLDLFFECFFPFTLTDRHQYTFHLKPVKDVRDLTSEETGSYLDRAAEMRRKLKERGGE